MPTSTADIPYRRDALYHIGPQPTYTGRHLAEIAFPLGGIGTGTLALGGRGELRDWEIFNRPDKGRLLPFAFFSLRAKTPDAPATLQVLEAPPLPPFNAREHGTYSGSGFGVPRETGAGLPHLREAAFRGEYPFASIEFTDPDCPVIVSLRAWNPMIPHEADDSGIPAAIFEWTLTNPGAAPVEITLAGNLPAFAEPIGQGEITVRRADGLTALQVDFPGEGPGTPTQGTLALATPWPTTTVQTRWLRADWGMGHFAPLMHWYERFAASGRFSEDTTPAGSRNDVGTLGAVATIPPGDTITIPLLITWSFPTFEKYWCGCESCEKARWTNYYARQFPTAWDAARYTVEHYVRLENSTLAFHHALFDSTLPAVVLDAISSQLSILKSTTCLRLPDGTFYGFEGCHGNAGCCEGSCTHVWNYAQTHAFLYPALERTMREAEYRYSQFPNGKVGFRLQLPLGSPPSDFHACADGQMGAIMQVYRDWQLGAGDAWLRAIWPGVRKSLAYAWEEWDRDRDGVMEGIQHNTYDTELHGPNAMCGVPYLGALRAAALMADYLGERDFAEECRRIEEAGGRALDALLFNGEYYIQPYDPASGLHAQVGTGCLIDQLLGQQLAHVYGLGYLLPEGHVRSAVDAVYRYNFQPDFRRFVNPERVFALNDEAGTVICTWPHGGRPEFPVPYADEAMIGFEYQLASHLIYEGMLDAGLAVTKAVRDRHDGERRNPWNEFECGNHYARSMANWSIKLALDGFSFAATEGRLGFAPRLPRAEYRTFWSTATAWGAYRQRPAAGEFELQVLHGAQELQRLDLVDLHAERVFVEGPAGPLAAEVIGDTVMLNAPVTVRAGERVRVMRE